MNGEDYEWTKKIKLKKEQIFSIFFYIKDFGNTVSRVD